MASRNTLDMTTGPIFRKLLLFAYPLIINSVVNTLYNIADKIIAGQFIGDTAMAAVGACTPPINLLNNFFIGLASGVGIVCGNYIGANRKTELRQCMHSAPVAGLLFGLLLGVLGLFCSRPLLVATSTPDSILPDAHTYMNVRMLGIPFGIANNFCINVLTAHGDTKRITLSGFLSGMLNVVGNLFFVIVIPMGIAGIALATNLSQMLALSIKVIILFSPKDVYRLRFSELRLHMNQLIKILSVGIPTAMNSLAFSFSNVLMQSSVNTLGPTVIAGNSGADTLMNLAVLFPTHMNAACSCAVAQCYGAANYQRIKEVVRKCLLGTTVMVIAANTLVSVFAMPIMGWFTDDPAVAAAGIPKLMFTIWGYIFYDFALIYAGALKGIHRSGIMMILNILGICLPRVLWVLFVFPFFPTPNVLYLIYPISYFTSALPMGTAYHHHLKKLINSRDQAPAI